MIQLDLNKTLNIYTLKCPEVIELQRLIDVSKDGIFGSKTKREVELKYGKNSVTLSDFKNMGYDVRNEISESEVWWLNTITATEDHEKRKTAMTWWNSLASLRKTQLCDTNPEIVGHVRRHETLTGSEIEKIYNISELI
jgi:hypothetical protein